MKPDNDSWQLERLSASEDSELVSALTVMKQRVPDASQLAALAAQLSAQGLPITSGAPAVPPVVRGAARLRRVSLIVGSALVGVGAVVLLLPRASLGPPPPPPVTAPVDLRDPIGSTPSLPTARERAAREASSLPANTGAPDSAGNPAPPPDLARDPAERNVLEAAPRAGLPPASANVTSAPSAQAREAGGAKALRSVSSPLGSGPESLTAARPSELVLLRDARLALRTSPSQALGLTEQHAMLYPRGAMAQERELIAISALASLGRRSAALARAADFERNFPNSPYRKQVTQLAR